MLPTPVDIGPWRWHRNVVMDTTSAVVAFRMMQRPPAPYLYEFWSVRGTMTHTGTGNLASMWLAADDEPPAGIGNLEETVMRQSEQANGVEILHHWGRDNQRRLGDETFYFPPLFYWGEELWQWIQNGAGAEVGYMIVLVHRLVLFRKPDYADLLAKIGGYKDNLLESAP